HSFTNLHPMILSVSMPLIFWTKMNDIRLRPLAIFFGWTPAKKPFTQARQTHCVRLTTPFFRPCIWSLKNVVVRRFA
ncbi:hypothetical protein, partial [Proteus mirabilis]|uniref:hypothetical protein n=1 Tax=Proteus mirabilis TaxID=584 RepID=UPI003315D086